MILYVCCIDCTYLDNISIVVVECHVVLKHICSGLGWQHIEDREFAVAGKEVSPLVQLLDLLMVINFLILVINEHVILDEHVQELAHATVRVEG